MNRFTPHFWFPCLCATSLCILNLNGEENPQKKKIDTAPVEVVTAHFCSFTLADVFAQVRTDWVEKRNKVAAEQKAAAEALMKE